MSAPHDVVTVKCLLHMMWSLLNVCSTFIGSVKYVTAKLVLQHYRLTVITV